MLFRVSREGAATRWVVLLGDRLYNTPTRTKRYWMPSTPPRMPATAGKKRRFGIKRPGSTERSGLTILAGLPEPRLLAQAPRQW
jgi:hypothetical protein